VFVEYYVKDSSSVGGVISGIQLWILEEFTVRRFAVILRKFHSEHSEDDLYWSKSQWDGRKGRADRVSSA